LLVKESAVIPFGLGTLVLAWHGARDSRRPSGALIPLAAGALAAALSGVMLIVLCGGWGTMLKVYELAREYTAPDDYMRNYQTGGIGYYLTGLGILQPLPWLLGGLGAVLAMVRPSRLARTARHPLAARALGALAIFVVGFCAVSFSYFSKNMRFLSPIYAPVALLAAATVSEGLASARQRLPRPMALAALGLTVAGLLTAAVLDAKRFDHYFNEIQIQDLATPWFTKANAGKL
jgi:asparagine N-glycosylation enzyme membrane subunit Stt3